MHSVVLVLHQKTIILLMHRKLCDSYLYLKVCMCVCMCMCMCMCGCAHRRRCACAYHNVLDTLRH